MTYRTGNHWGRTIVLEGTEPADASGRRPDDRLVATVDSAAPEGLAKRIVERLNVDEPCDCGHEGLDGLFHAGCSVAALNRLARKHGYLLTWFGKADA